jgi:hypothetical protein
MMSDKGANMLGEIAATLADGEGLQLSDIIIREDFF